MQLVASLLMTIHKQKSKENPVDCSATYFPSSFQREKQRDGTDPTPSVPASLSASGSMCNGAGGTRTLSAQRTNRALMSSLVLPKGWGMKSCCFTYQSIGQGPGAVQASHGSPETLVLTTWGERLHLHLWDPIGRQLCGPGVCPVASGCTDFLSGGFRVCGLGSH